MTYFLEGTDRRIAFTEEGRKMLGPYFARAGIDLTAIRTKDDYLAARAGASPYLRHYLSDLARDNDGTLEDRLIVAIMDGDKAA